MGLKENLGKDKHFLLLSIIILYLGFTSASNWFSDGCVVTASDFEYFRTLGSFIHEQFTEYGFVYPVSFGSIHGAIYFMYSALPFMIPLLITPLFGYLKSFMITYVLFYCLSALSIYILLSQTSKDKFAPIMAALFFLLSPALNTQFTVYGNYHTIIALPFFFLAITYLLKYESESTKNNAIMFFTFSFLVGASHIFTYMFYFIFAFAYLVLRKQKKPLIILLLATTALSWYFVPVAMEQLSKDSNQQTTEISGNFIDNFDNLFFKKFDSYSPQMDSNYRPYLLIGALIAILFFSIKKDKKSMKLSINALTEKIPPYMLVFSSVLLLMVATQGYTRYTSLLSFERYGLFAQISFILIICQALSRIKINIPIYITLIFLLALISPSLGRISPLLLIPAIYLILVHIRPKTDSCLKEREEMSNITKKDTIMMILLTLALIYPLTGNILGSNIEPRFWCNTLPHVSDLITPKDTYHDQMESYSSISTITGAKRSGGMGSMPYHTKAPLDNSDSDTYNLLKNEEITKIIIAIYSDDYQQRYAHLFQWFGNPAVIQGTRRDYPQYYLVFDTGFTNDRDYEMDINTPTDITITKDIEKEDQFIHLTYHAWWQTETEGVTLEKDPDGFTVIKNAKGIDTVHITWDYTWFYAGWIMTILSIIGLFISTRKLPGETNEHNPDNVEDDKSKERSRHQSRKKTQRIKKQKRNKYQKNP